MSYIRRNGDSDVQEEEGNLPGTNIVSKTEGGGPRVDAAGDNDLILSHHKYCHCRLAMVMVMADRYYAHSMNQALSLSFLWSD